VRATLGLTELFDLRRACRSFRPDPVPRDVLLRVVDAASRAPTASNVPYRQLMVVESRPVIRAVRQIHPALQADPPALLIVMTDVDLAIARVGPIGESSSLIDSGAAGENAWLAALDEGLATGFTMISAMAGIRTILSLPESMRVDLIMPLGYPSEPPLPPTRARTRRHVHLDQYGNLHAGA
jgi:nitroreductase